MGAEGFGCGFFEELGGNFCFFVRSFASGDFAKLQIYLIIFDKIMIWNFNICREQLLLVLLRITSVVMATVPPGNRDRSLSGRLAGPLFKVRILKVFYSLGGAAVFYSLDGAAVFYSLGGASK